MQNSVAKGVRDISFTLNAGEVLGLAGLMGSVGGQNRQELSMVSIELSLERFFWKGGEINV